MTLARYYSQYCTALLVAGFVICPTAVWSVEFTDYDYNQWSQKPTQCDRLASHHNDPGHVAPPVTLATMDREAAIVACLAALKEDPNNPRLNYQLGRAYGYSGRGEDAMPYRLTAIEADYPQSLFVIGYLYINGRTIEKDVCKALKLWQRGARYRIRAALVSLPRHYMRGDFDGCGVIISNDDLRDILNEAAASSDDYYFAMIVEDLLADLNRQRM